EKTGAPIVYGPRANPSFGAQIATDGQTFKLGAITIKALHTPGHTLESTTYLLLNEKGKAHAIFTGDTLFLGDVGRPDLAQKNNGITQEQLAGLLYKSLREKIMPLPDTVTVYPAHGAGSACGKNMMKETVDTLGNQKKMNYALRENMTEAEFITEVTEGLLPPPAYFPLNVKMNKEGYENIETVVQKGKNALAPGAFEHMANQTGALVLDVRHQSEFVKGFIPSSVFIGIDGGFAPWVGTLVQDVAHPILLVVNENRVEETITRLSRVGFDNTLGYLKGGFKAWKNTGKAVDSLKSISAEEFKNGKDATNAHVFDVRKPGEFQEGHIATARHTPLAELNQRLAEFPNTGTSYIHCAGGYRSVIAASILKRRGIHNVVDVAGGIKAIRGAGVPLVQQKIS
ncbi:MAG: MBL fold metallo-hydrolase, partial [Marinirhabdus sp.]